MHNLFNAMSDLFDMSILIAVCAYICYDVNVGEPKRIAQRQADAKNWRR